LGNPAYHQGAFRAIPVGRVSARGERVPLFGHALNLCVTLYNHLISRATGVEFAREEAVGACALSGFWRWRFGEDGNNRQTA